MSIVSFRLSIYELLIVLIVAYFNYGSCLTPTPGFCMLERRRRRGWPEDEERNEEEERVWGCECRTGSVAVDEAIVRVHLAAPLQILNKFSLTNWTFETHRILKKRLLILAPP